MPLLDVAAPDCAAVPAEALLDAPVAAAASPEAAGDVLPTIERRQTGHVPLRLSHGTRQSAWKRCWHGTVEARQISLQREQKSEGERTEEQLVLLHVLVAGHDLWRIVG